MSMMKGGNCRISDKTTPPLLRNGLLLCQQNSSLHSGIFLAIHNKIAWTDQSDRETK